MVSTGRTSIRSCAELGCDVLTKRQRAAPTLHSKAQDIRIACSPLQWLKKHLTSVGQLRRIAQESYIGEPCPPVPSGGMTQNRAPQLCCNWPRCISLRYAIVPDRGILDCAGAASAHRGRSHTISLAYETRGTPSDNQCPPCVWTFGPRRTSQLDAAVPLSCGSNLISTLCEPFIGCKGPLEVLVFRARNEAEIFECRK